MSDAATEKARRAAEDQEFSRLVHDHGYCTAVDWCSFCENVPTEDHPGYRDEWKP